MRRVDAEQAYVTNEVKQKFTRAAGRKRRIHQTPSRTEVVACRQIDPTPVRPEASDANLQGGAVNAGTSQLYQQLTFRLIPGLGRAETPSRTCIWAARAPRRAVQSTASATATPRGRPSPATHVAGRVVGSTKRSCP